LPFSYRHRRASVPAIHSRRRWSDCAPRSRHGLRDKRLADRALDGEGSVMAHRPFISVYMMTNRRHGTLYVGVTSDLITRVVQHIDGTIPGFTATYGLKRLVWYEPHELIVEAIKREKSIKKYKREWKLNLIEQTNPHWDDLFEQLH
jgi:putative endonuclease